MIRQIKSSQHASILLLALGWMAILAAIAGATLFAIHGKHRQAFQAVSWHDSLTAAESGVDMAVNELRKTLADPTTAWTGWTRSDGGTGPLTSGSAFLSSSALLRSYTEGGQRTWADVQVDAPAFLVDQSGEQWFRVRSMGYAEIPGGAIVTGEKPDVQLRKLSLTRDRWTGAAITRPRASRLIEAIIKPVGTFRVALLSVDTINMNNLNIVVDSYDSRNPAKSTNGFYDPAKRQDNGDIATNGALIEVGNAHIYGDASTNGGAVLNTSNVTGEIRNDFYQELFPVQRPVMTPTAGTPSSVSSATIVNASAGSPTQVVLSTINLSGSNTLRIRGAADGSETFAQILVTGNVSLSGQAGIILDPGVYVRMFVVGDADITGQGVANPNRPLNFQLYGVDRPSGAAAGQMKIAGNGGFRGSVYAPNYDISMVGGGSGDSIYGGFVGKNIRMTGVQAVHYDEALADGGLISDYRVVSWFEDAAR
jgi:hypothetical protein